MKLRSSIAGLFCTTGLLALVAGNAAEPPAPAKENSPAPLYFSSPAEAVRAATPLLAARDWATLSRYYDLTLTPDVTRAQLLDGSFFVDATQSPSGPTAITRWRQPFPPGSEMLEAGPLGETSHLPCIWAASTMLSIDQGGSPMQRVVRQTRLIQTPAGFQFLPPGPLEKTPSPAPITDQQWSAQGADHILLFRPTLVPQAKAEVPAGRSSNISSLVQALAQLAPRAAAHPGKPRAGSQPWEPATVYEPTDDELLLSLAGDRIWRSLQLVPPGTLAQVRRDHPELTADAIEYPHIEIVRVAVAGTGPRLYAKPPESRRVNLRAP